MDYKKLHKDTITRLQQMVDDGKITVEIACGICADFVPESTDERIRKALISRFNESGELDGISYNDIRIWLEKQSKQKPKQEWSEEDKETLNSILNDLRQGVIPDNEDINWLRSLCPQPH